VTAVENQNLSEKDFLIFCCQKDFLNFLLPKISLLIFFFQKNPEGGSIAVTPQMTTPAPQPDGDKHLAPDPNH